MMPSRVRGGRGYARRAQWSGLSGLADAKPIFPESLILDLTRADRNPAWPLILAQLLGRQPDPPACDAPLAAAVAAHAAAQALAFIDRPYEAGAVPNGTLELVLPSWQWRRTWPPHPDCGCGSRCR
jgi:hypothetical protein